MHYLVPQNLIVSQQQCSSEEMHLAEHPKLQNFGYNAGTISPLTNVTSIVRDKACAVVI
jgi:hypothetical protein